MSWYNNSPKSVDVEELVRRCITDYADSRKFIVYDNERNKEYSAVKYNQTFVEELSESLVKNVFGVLFSQLTNQNSKGSKKSQDNDFVSVVDRIDKTTYSGLTYEDKHSGKRYYSLPKIINNQSEFDATLKSVLSELTRLAKIQETTISEKNAIIQKQHDSLLRYDNDLLYKTKIPMLREVIDIADQIKQIADDQNMTVDYAKLLEDVQALRDWVDATLQTESVRKFEHAKSKPYEFNPKYQEIVETQYTSKIEDDGKYKTMLPGYFWTIPMVGSSMPPSADNSPRSFEFVLRHEQIIRLKYKPDTEIKRKEKDVDDSVNGQILDSKSTTASKTSSVEDILTQRTVLEINSDNSNSQRGANCSQAQVSIEFNREEISDSHSNGQSMVIRDLPESLATEHPSQVKEKNNKGGRSKK